ncbi:unannotated protein [freshwater metagenome]|uniref:Unannotated protein n=1 Tax=freshwater metagenome TaxID=449393 RepID=A0A6J7USJ4_9ZZZZ
MGQCLNSLCVERVCNGKKDSAIFFTKRNHGVLISEFFAHQLERSRRWHCVSQVCKRNSKLLSQRCRQSSFVNRTKLKKNLADAGCAFALWVALLMLERIDQFAGVDRAEFEHDLAQFRTI